MPPGPRQASPVALLTPGTVVAGKYQIVSVIGEGGMGVVYEATHLRLRQRVAMKMLLPDMLTHEVVVSRFEREARAAGQLRNRHAARVMDVDVTEDGLPYMVMEFLEGRDLQTELDERGQLPHVEAVDYLLQACSAMIEAHQLGIVHRDLKPANLFLAVEAEAADVRIVKVLDFGISKVPTEESDKLTTPDSVMGTAMYMSPEQIRSSKEVDARSDIWSLGIILYELLTGKPPWLGTTTQIAASVVSEDVPDVRLLCPTVPVEIAAIIQRALRRDAAERFPNVKELALALAPFASPGGPGRILADGLLNASTTNSARISVRDLAPIEEARTVVQAAAVSQPRIAGEGTSPGWSQASQPTRRRSTVTAIVAAFTLGLIVLGGVALAWLRWGAKDQARAPEAQTASATGVVAAPAQPSAAASADPPASATGTGAAPPPPVSAAATAVARPRPPPVGRPTTASGAPATPARPTVPSKPTSVPTGNPLTL